MEPHSVHEARRVWDARSLSVWRNRGRGTLSLRAELPAEVGELVIQAIERAMAAHGAGEGGESEVCDGGMDGSAASFQSQQADALVAIARAYLAGGADESSFPRQISIKLSSTWTKKPSVEGRGGPIRPSRR